MAGQKLERNCPLCEEKSAQPLFKKADLSLVRCRDCRMIYANPVEADLASGTFYDHLSVPFYLSPGKLESDYAPVRFERELKLLRSFCPRGEVLDVGCSTGAFLFQLQKRYPADYEVFGMDVAGAALDYAESRGIRAVRGSFLDLDFGQRRFAAITFWAVLEHLVQPRLFLKRAARLLQPGGHCIILVPNMNSLAVRLLGRKYRYIMPDHVNYFTAATLDRLARSEPALVRVGHGSTHFNPIVILQDLKGGDQRVPDPQRVQLLQRTTAYKQNPWLRPVKVLYRLGEMFLGSLGLADNIYAVYRKDGA